MDLIEQEYQNFIYSIPQNIENLKDVVIRPVQEIESHNDFGKFYSLVKHNIDALKGKYFYASHPLDLNDPFDSNLNIFLFHYKTVDVELLKTIHDETFRRIGIVSLTREFESPIMWGYYTNHNGFLVKYRKIKQTDNYSGPYPVNYIESLQPINFTYNKSIDLRLLTIINTNIKNKKWIDEGEWRLILESNEQMKLPRILYKDYSEFKCDDAKERYISYKGIFEIEEIVLGYKFFLNNEDDWKREGGTYLYHTCNSEKLRLLKIIKEIGCKVSRVDINPNEFFKLTFLSTSIEPVNNNCFIIKNKTN